MINYYTVLEVSDFAPFEGIRIAYRRLSKEWHPDLNNGSAYHAEKFKDIQTAYECLSKPDKRELYDYKLRNHLNGYQEEATAEPQYQYHSYSSYNQPSYQRETNPNGLNVRMIFGIIYLIYIILRIFTCNSSPSADIPYQVVPMTYQYNKTAQEILDSIAKANRPADSAIIPDPNPSGNIERSSR